ncbi:SGNH/GDSL hydrolase family protein [Ottowia thiooxydans]|uniref:SGNH/GDSL hydrolase family protein n=1 Tax=Ottowia thiooxydans TaxID=219182 RepID=UPI000413AF4C|nr:SGNH/GDSL hydrolase family protein [Ottowia thiooxydans]
MTSLWSRRAVLTAASAGVAAAALSACGSGSVASAITPKRFLSVGDGFSDVGQNGYRFTVNDGTLLWTQQLASYYSLPLTAASAGGFSYAQGHAMVATADTISGTNAPSVSVQIDSLLARTAMASDDIAIVTGGIADIVNAVNATGISAATTQTVKAAGVAQAAQVRRLVAAGATHVVVAGVYNLGMSPWALGQNLATGVQDLSVAFNDQLLIGIADLGATVLYLDPALFYNLIAGKPTNYPFDDVTRAVCTTADATTCNATTILAGADFNRYVFADNLYFTPAAQRLFVNESFLENAYTRLKLRW